MTSAVHYPTEAKVWAGTVGSGAGVTLSAFVVWLLGVAVWRAPVSASHAVEAAAAVPAPVSALVVLAVTAGSTYTAGWFAKHTPRADGLADWHPPTSEPAAASARLAA